MTKFLALANSVNGKFEIYKIISENDTVYTLNTGKRLFKDDSFITLLTAEQVEKNKHRFDTVLMY